MRMYFRMQRKRVAHSVVLDISGSVKQSLSFVLVNCSSYILAPSLLSASQEDKYKDKEKDSDMKLSFFDSLQLIISMCCTGRPKLNF